MTCSVQGCSMPHRARGFCSGHYKAARREGQIDLMSPPGPRFCEVEGCKRLHRAKGFCSVHYDKFRGKKRDNSKRAPRPPADNRRLPSGPIQRWILARHETLEELGERLHMDPRGLRRIMEQEKTTLDVVDRILCDLHCPEMLRELYPDLYEFTEEEMKEAEAWAMS